MKVALTAAITYALFLCYLVFGLRLNLVQGDVLAYWRESLAWETPFSVLWAPGYPLLIALVRSVTPKTIPPLAVMSMISAASYTVAVMTVYKIAIALRAGRPLFIALLFGVYPFVGLTYSVYPLADSTALALVLLCVLCMERRSWGAFVVFAGTSLVVHKATWFFVPPLIVATFLRHREARLLCPLAAVPLILWIVAGASYHHDLFWFMRWGMDNLVRSRTSLPIFDGLITPLLSDSPNKVGKGIVVLATFLLSVTLLYRCYRLQFWSGFCISLSVILMCTVVNSFEIWAAVRFSKLLVIPLAYSLRHAEAHYPVTMKPWVHASVLIGCLVSNLAYGVYFTRFLSGP